MVAKRTILNSATVSPKRPELDRDSNLVTRLPVTPVSKTKALSSHLKSIFLHDWWLVKVQVEGLTVGGVASTETQGERVFRSTVITKRHETNVLETKDGITVVISGFINRSRTHQNGFPLEICDDFLFGFPHNWEEYTSKSFGEHINGVNGFGGSNMRSQKRAAFYVDDIHATRNQDVLLSNNGDLNYCWLPRKICNELAKWQGNISELSELIDTMEHNNTMKTTECIPNKDNKILKTSQPGENQMHDGENEICNDPRKWQGNTSEQSEPTDTIEHNNVMKTLECIHKEDITTLVRSQPGENQMYNGENEICNLRKCLGNFSEQSEPTDTIEHNDAMKTVECSHREDITTLKRSQTEDNQMHNGENGVLDVDITTLRTSRPEDNHIHSGENGVLDVKDIGQDGSPKSDCQTVMSRNSAISCRELSVSRYKTPISATKEKKGHLSNKCKKESTGQKKLLEDGGNPFRRVTRSISKGSQKTIALGTKEEIRVKCVHTPVRRSATPVRRSARLCNLRK